MSFRHFAILFLTAALQHCSTFSPKRQTSTVLCPVLPLSISLMEPNVISMSYSSSETPSVIIGFTSQ